MISFLKFINYYFYLIGTVLINERNIQVQKCSNVSVQAQGDVKEESIQCLH